MPDKQPMPISEAFDLPELASSPNYPRHELSTGIVHLGMGHFHRAHLARYMQTILNEQPEDWMIHGIGTLDNDKDRALVGKMQNQDGLYTLIERSKDTDTVHVIGSIKEASHAPTDPRAVVAAMALDSVKIISLTVTEKGYGNTPDGKLDTVQPLVAHDLQDVTYPQSTLGLLYAAAETRMREKGEPVTIMSCDNMRGNGDSARRLLLDFASHHDPAVRRWIEDNMTFPNSMVDRITPATSEQTIALVREQIGIDDTCPVMSEDFIQWVLEDDFTKGRPAFETAGVQIVEDVKPYEALKTRMLNGTHFALAYTAYLMGYRNVEDAMDDELLSEYLIRYMDEDVTPSLPAVPGINVPDYKKKLLERFSNPAINDQVQRLASDATPKIQTYIMPVLMDQLERGGSIKWLTFALASWFRYASGTDEDGREIAIFDPSGYENISPLAATSISPATIDKVMGEGLGSNERFVTELNEAFSSIKTLGTKQALARRLRS